ncbi:hypothetical protein [Candidatus Spongiihabitans sp.]|uniref:hypothetical protein n=1 Tax=Candidatus Spongiihabitans sp. TaxID=3101308 RepID=UPI003C7B12A3
MAKPAEQFRKITALGQGKKRAIVNAAEKEFDAQGASLTTMVLRVCGLESKEANRNARSE